MTPFLWLAAATVSLGLALQDGNLTDIVEYVLLDEENPCARKCVKDALPMTCRYHFTLEYYESLSKACYRCPFKEEDCYKQDCIPADGFKRPVLVANRKLPGPKIEVCLGDEVIIDVENQLGSESTTIHWHGQHQKEDPYMDGVPMVSQCPIPPYTTFRYHFSVRNSGTHFWHSHSGFQRADGAFGPFVVRVPEEDDPHASLYDYDLSSHIITILDWDGELGLQKFVGHHHSDGDNKPPTLLVNGQGRFKQFYEGANAEVVIPAARFTVEQGYRYRFRVINAGFLNCPIEISADNHTLTVISGDGADFEAVEVESIVTYAGERFDFIINADQAKDVYWIRFSGLMDCDERFKRAHQVAVLEYKDAEAEYPSDEPTYENSKKNGTQLNSLNIGTETNNTLNVILPQLVATNEWDSTLQEDPDFQYYVSYDFYRIDNPHYNRFPYYGIENMTDPKLQMLTPQLNYISMKLLPFPILPQRHLIEASMVCNETTVKNCATEYCECPHVVNVPLNSVVEMILIDKGYTFDANHPFHLHGHSFRVVAMERIGKTLNISQIVDRDKQGLIKRNLVNAPLKDTVTVPDGGYTIIRFLASNPGFWLFHCHIEFHVEVGMGLVFKVGENEDMPPVPEGFPTCGSYVHELRTEECIQTGSIKKVLNKILPKSYRQCEPSSSQNLFVTESVLVALILFMVILR